MRIAKLIPPCIMTLACLLLSPFAGLAVEQNHDDVVAKVGNIEISSFDLRWEVEKTIPLQVSFHGGLKPEKLAKIKAEALEALIERAYKVQYALDEEISVEAQSLEEAWGKFQEKNAKKMPHATDAQLNELKANLYFDLLAAKAEEVAVGSKVDVSDEAVKRHYEEHRAEYLQPKLFTASHVFVRVSPSANKEEQKAALKRAEELMARAESGEDFYNLAYYESDDRSKYVGGSLGTFHPGQTVEEFDAALQKMKPGDVRGPVRTIYGYHIIKMDALEEERQLSLEEVAGRIRKQLEAAEREKLYGAWMETLKGRYPVERMQ